VTEGVGWQGSWECRMLLALYFHSGLGRSAELSECDSVVLFKVSCLNDCIVTAICRSSNCQRETIQPRYYQSR